MFSLSPIVQCIWTHITRSHGRTRANGHLNNYENASETNFSLETYNIMPTTRAHTHTHARTPPLHVQRSPVNRRMIGPVDLQHSTGDHTTTTVQLRQHLQAHTWMWRDLLHHCGQLHATVTRTTTLPSQIETSFTH